MPSCGHSWNYLDEISILPNWDRKKPWYWLSFTATGCCCNYHTVYGLEYTAGLVVIFIEILRLILVLWKLPNNFSLSPQKLPIFTMEWPENTSWNVWRSQKQRKIRSINYTVLLEKILTLRKLRIFFNNTMYCVGLLRKRSLNWLLCCCCWILCKIDKN